MSDLQRCLLIQYSEELRRCGGSLFFGLDKVRRADVFLVIGVNVDVLHKFHPEVIRLVGNDLEPTLRELCVVREQLWCT